jgi:DNA-binding response OmpR family regulator
MNSLQNKVCSVLILENDVDLANSIRLYLEDCFIVYTIDNPSQLIDYVSKYKIDFIITDFDTPDPNLTAKLQLIKCKNPQVKIIVIYMFLDEDEFRKASFLKEADDCIFKPFDADVLKYKINKLITKPTPKKYV